MTPSQISVVIPALNEEKSIGDAIESAFSAGAGEVILVDGGSRDRTIAEAQQRGVTKVVQSLPGRGVQLNAGATFVGHQQAVIVFLHADNRLTDHCLQQICVSENLLWGAFRQSIDSGRWIYRLVELGNDLRVKYWRMPFGDQAIFVLKDEFRRRGGFEEIPLMEDVAFSKKMRRIAKPCLLQGPVQVSCRRWEKKGVVIQTLQNWFLQAAYKLGVRPDTIRDWYR